MKNPKLNKRGASRAVTFAAALALAVAAELVLPSAPAAVLDADAWFEPVTTGSVVTDSGNSYGCAWGDYDNDGFIDLFVANYAQPPFLHHNNRDGTFTRVTVGVVATTVHASYGGVWGDADNDGWLDLFVSDFGSRSALYRNSGGGVFSLLVSNGIPGGEANGCAWADYDNDGLLDLFVANHLDRHILLRGDGRGAFTRIQSGAIATDIGHVTSCTWSDCDNDGSPDLLVTNHQLENFFYGNNRDGTFRRLTVPGGAGTVGDSHGAAWGDFDNDGLPDLFVANPGMNNWLFRNRGDGAFARITEGSLVNGATYSQACAWADFDHDGWLDLFVANSGQNNGLYRNNGDGTFAPATAGAVVSDGGNSQACAWGDYDNDGFPDLVVANYGGENFLYHNRGNSNHWLNVRCVGSASNRAAIGAKVRVRAVVAGAERWQMREISGGTGRVSQNDLRASFGLGDATNADLVRIEWPSGTVQELRHVAANQFLTVTEPPRLRAVASVDGQFHLTLTGGVGWRYAIERSTNLVDWVPRATVTNDARTITWMDAPEAALGPCYYRAVGR